MALTLSSGSPLSFASSSSLGSRLPCWASVRLHALELVTALEQVHRDADGLALVGDGARHGLADPPRGVRREAVAAAPVELLDGADEAELPLLHEVVHVEPLADEAARVGHHQAEVGAHELVLGARGLVHPADEPATRALVRPATAGVAREPREDVTLEAGFGQLDRHPRAAATAALARGLFPRGTRRQRGRAGRSVEQLGELLGARLAVGVLLGVAQERRTAAFAPGGPLRRARGTRRPRRGPSAGRRARPARRSRCGGRARPLPRA